MFGSRNFLFAKSIAGAANKLFSWGNNSYGGLGLGNTTNYSSPKQVGTLTTWDYPSIGGITNHASLCNKTDGTLWAWGNGANGNLAQGSPTSNIYSPVQIGALTTWGRPVITSSYAALCIKTDGTLWSWGSGYKGATAQGSGGNLQSPVQVGALTNWSKLGQATYNNILCVKTDGTLWAWGNNQHGQLGLGDTTTRYSPVQVGALTDWATPATGSSTSFCVKTNGTLWAWGRGLLGGLGLGNTTNYSSPKQVGSLTNWSKPSGGNFSSACVKTDGTAWVWGYNGAGQLGLGNTTSYSSPKQIGSNTNWSYVRAGWNVTAGVTTDGTLFTWGKNELGQLGLGNITNYSSPKQIGALTNWKNITVARTAMLCSTE